jgi:hypothetical protein
VPRLTPFCWQTSRTCSKKAAVTFPRTGLGIPCAIRITKAHRGCRAIHAAATRTPSPNSCAHHSTGNTFGLSSFKWQRQFRRLLHIISVVFPGESREWRSPSWPRRLKSFSIAKSSLL